MCYAIIISQQNITITLASSVGLKHDAIDAHAQLHLKVKDFRSPTIAVGYLISGYDFSLNYYILFIFQPKNEKKKKSLVLKYLNEINQFCVSFRV